MIIILTSCTQRWEMMTGFLMCAITWSAALEILVIATLLI